MIRSSCLGSENRLECEGPVISRGSCFSQSRSKRERPKIAYYVRISISTRNVVETSTSLFFAALFMVCAALVHAQSVPDAPSADQQPASQNSPSPLNFSPSPVALKSLPKNLFLDQKNFWTA